MIQATLAILFLFLWAGAADAGPAVPMFAAAAKGFAATTFGAAVTQTAIGMGLSALARAVFKPERQRRAGTENEVATEGEQTPQTIILGRAKTDGHLNCPPYVYETDNDPGEWMVYVIELMDGVITGLGDILIDGERAKFKSSPINVSGAGPGATVNGKYDGKVFVRVHRGNQTAPDAYLRAALGNYPERPWTADMVLRGVAYAVVTLKGRQKDKVFTGGFPKVRFEVDGLALLDPRDNQTKFTLNPMVMAWNIHRGISMPSGDVWGYQIPAASIISGPAFSSMNACDEAVSIGSGATEPRYRAGIEFSVDQEPSDIVALLMDACHGDAADMGGEIILSAGPPNPSVYSFHDRDVLSSSPEDFDPFPGLDKTINFLNVSGPDPESGWEIKEGTPVTDAAWIAEDGGRKLPESVILKAVPYPRQRNRVANEMAKDHRRMRNHVVPLPPDAGHIRVLDTVDWTSPHNRYNKKLFEVRKKDVDPTTGCVILQIRERDPSDYIINPARDNVFPAPSNNTPVESIPTGGFGWKVEAVDAGGKPGIKMSWDNRISATDVSWTIAPDATPLRVASTGTTTDIEKGYHTVSGDLRNNIAYRVEGKIMRGAKVLLQETVVINTLNIGIPETDLAQAIRDRIAKALADAAKASTDVGKALSDADAASRKVDVEVGKVNTRINTDLAEIDGLIDAIQKDAGATKTTLANVVDTNGQVKSSALLAYYNKTTSDAAIAASTNALESKYFSNGQIKATAVTNYYTKADANSAISAANTALKSSMEGPTGSVGKATAAAQAASDLAGGKGKVFFQSTEPPVAERLSQNLWIDLAGGNNIPKRWNGTAWGIARDKAATDALAKANAVAGDLAIIDARLDTDFYTKTKADEAIAAAQMKIRAEYGRILPGVADPFLLASSGWLRWSGQGTLATRNNEFYPTGTTWDFTVTATQADGISLNSKAAGWYGQENAEGYAIEVEYSLLSGSWPGAGFYVYWTNTAGVNFNFVYRLSDAASGAGPGGNRIARFVATRPKNFTGTFASNTVYAFANHPTAFGNMSAKRIKFHRIVIRPATDEEMGGGAMLGPVLAEVLTRHYTKADTDSAIAGKIEEYNASISGGVKANVTQTATALATLRNSMAGFKHLATTGGAGAAGIEAISINPNTGAASKGTVKLHGDNVIAEKTMSARAFVTASGANVLQDPEFSDDLTHWNFGLGGGMAATAGLRRPGMTYVSPAGPTAYIYQDNAVQTGNADLMSAPVITRNGGKALGTAIRGGQFYVGSVFVACHRCDFELYLSWYAADGTALGSPSSGRLRTPSGSATNPDEWQRVWVAAKAPLTAAMCRFRMRKWGTQAGATDSWVFLWHPQLEEAWSDGQEPGVWSPGGTTYINGGRTITKSLSADAIDVANLSAISADIGIMRTATTGERLEIRKDMILVYDANNRLRVRLGSL